MTTWLPLVLLVAWFAFVIYATRCPVCRSWKAGLECNCDRRNR
jgi:hypothetical protein